jgi:hypothetical protein
VERRGLGENALKDLGVFVFNDLNIV